MNELQKCLLDILKEFIRVCDENNLTYFVVGGTCLGAVRHQGFIPWDDDIDVAMPRSDYEKFLKLQDKFDKKYFIQTYKTDKNFILNHAKVRNSSTTYIEDFYRTMNINHGVWIDVFPLDGISKKMKKPSSFAHRIRYVWWNTYMMYLPALKRKVHRRTFFKDVSLSIVGILFFWLNFLNLRNRWAEAYMKRIPYDKAVMVGNLVGTNPKKEAMPREVFNKGTKVMFEGIEVNAPEKYDEYLTFLFNDYMKLPPIEKQVGHHHNKGYSLTQSYKDYIKEHRL